MRRWLDVFLTLAVLAAIVITAFQALYGGEMFALTNAL